MHLTYIPIVKIGWSAALLASLQDPLSCLDLQFLDVGPPAIPAHPKCSSVRMEGVRGREGSVDLH